MLELEIAKNDEAVQISGENFDDRWKSEKLSRKVRRLKASRTYSVQSGAYRPNGKLTSLTFNRS